MTLRPVTFVQSQEPIKGSLYLPYLALESTPSRVDLLIERFPQFKEPIKTELWQSLFHPHAHDQVEDSKERLHVDDSSDKSLACRTGRLAGPAQYTSAHAKHEARNIHV